MILLKLHFYIKSENILM